MHTVTIQGPANVSHGFDYRSNRYVCKSFPTYDEAYKHSAGILCTSFLPTGKANTYAVSDAGDDAQQAREGHMEAQGRWFGNFETAE